jgi:hypothetical protein
MQKNLVHGPTRTSHNSCLVANIYIYTNIEQIKLIYRFFKTYTCENRIKNGYHMSEINYFKVFVLCKIMWHDVVVIWQMVDGVEVSNW